MAAQRPVQAPTNFELVTNRKTGGELLAIADEVIE
jgi:hypothetical protein